MMKEVLIGDFSSQMQRRRGWLFKRTFAFFKWYNLLICRKSPISPLFDNNMLSGVKPCTNVPFASKR